MGIINRFLLFLYALAVACLSLGVVALALQIVPEPILLNEYRYLMGAQQWQLVAGGVLVFLLSIHLIGCSFSGGSDKREGGEFLVLHGKSSRYFESLPPGREMNEMLGITSRNMLRFALITVFALLWIG